MNIFVLDNDPEQAARDHCDKHAVKMIVETAQLLSTAHHLLGTGDSLPRKTHENHPCAKWVRESDENYRWAAALGRALCATYSRRYGRLHAWQGLLAGPLAAPPSEAPRGTLTPFAQAMPEQYRCTDAVRAYRLYYVGEKLGFARWRNNMPPLWLDEYRTKLERL